MRRDAAAPLGLVLARALPLQLAEAPLPEPPAISLIWHSRVEGDPAQRWLRKMIAEAFRSSPALGLRRG